MTLRIDAEGDELVSTVTATPAAVQAATSADGLIDVRLTAIRYAARDTNLYEFTRLDGKPLPSYQPGAHIDLHLPNGLVRQYSLIEADPDPASYRVGIKRDPASRGGSRNRWPVITACSVSPVNGVTPANISYVMTPSA